MRKLLWLGAISFAAYEVYALMTKEAGDTISEKFWVWCRRPLVPFATGMLVGHFVWQSQEVYRNGVKNDLCLVEAGNKE